ncbi:MAG: RagB/SusD family nutrient uptake outer membrane protein [Bacteroidales bacterium]|nr:RagB/SusD family nutrient uptake outer membrane protein [Bacteroidales bacterium]
MKISNILATIAIATVLTGCGDKFLTAHSTGQAEAGGEATEGAIVSYLASAYQILLFDSYANQNYNAVFLLSDLRSDDIYKGGGDASDQAWMGQLSTFTISANTSPTGLWSIYFTGIQRSNNTIIACQNAVGMESAPERLARYDAEAHFLRAYYTHLLWKYYGNIPYFEEPLSVDPYMTRQMTADEVYNEILEDLEVAAKEGVLPMTSTELGRTNRAAALMLRARVIMYQKDQARYAQAASDMAAIISSGAYQLFPDFDAMWLEENEFCSESIFESNQLDAPTGGDQKDWGSGWHGYGTNLPAFISPNGLEDPSGVFKGGWGFGPVRAECWDMFEAGDVRRDASILDWRGVKYNPRYQDTGFFQKKYAAREGYNPPPGDQDLNYDNNLRIFRYAETLLNYAELVGVLGASPVSGISAQECMDAVRTRAGLGSVPVSAESIKAERRYEFFGEGMRFWDLIRWGDAEKVLTETVNANGWNYSRKFNPAKDKYLPIPQHEMDNTKGFGEFELKQNNGY